MATQFIKPVDVKVGDKIRISRGAHLLTFVDDTNWSDIFEEVVQIDVDPSCPAEMYCFFFEPPMPGNGLFLGKELANNETVLEREAN